MNAVVDTRTEPMLLREDANGVATLTLNRPRAYWVPAHRADVIERLRIHGVQMEILTAPRLSAAFGHPLRAVQDGDTTLFVPA